jgi:D-threo-aldose 1-dehydrogenase
VSSLVVGAVSPEEVAANVAGIMTPIPPSLWDELRAADLVHAAAPVPQPT